MKTFAIKLFTKISVVGWRLNSCVQFCAKVNKTETNSASETVTVDPTLRGQVFVDPSSGDAALTLTDTNETN